MFCILFLSLLLAVGVHLATWDFKDCGYSLVPLITGGKLIVPGQYPWLAALYMRDNTGEWSVICGGTLISPDIVLTAAHCLQHKSFLHPDNIKIGLGKIHRDINSSEPNSHIFSVDEAVFPQYFVGTSSVLALDVGLIRLSQTVSISPFITPACFDWEGTNIVYSSTEGHVAGWGKSENTTATEEALSVKLSYIDFLACRHAYSSVLYGRFMSHHGFCALNSHGGQVEAGDSGGGLTVLHNDRQYVIGVVSWKIIGKINFSVFTNISNPEIHSWIRGVTSRWNETGGDAAEVKNITGSGNNYQCGISCDDCGDEGKYPWVALIYAWRTEAKWTQKCIGTLITPHIVLTNSVCVRNGNDFSRPKNLKVGLGKSYRNYDTTEPNSEFAMVREIVFSPLFADSQGRIFDIYVLLDLVSNVKISNYVMPACVDWNNLVSLQSGTEMKLAGWGDLLVEDEKGTYVWKSYSHNEKITESRQTYISLQDCRTEGKPFEIPADNFCSHIANVSDESRTCTGCSLTVQRDGKHYLAGVLSSVIRRKRPLYLYNDLSNVENSKWINSQKIRLEKLH